MKFSTILTPLLAAFAVAAPAVHDVTVESVITGLTTEVKGYTGTMNASLASLPENATPAQRQVVVSAVNKDITNIAHAFHRVNTQLSTASVSRRAQPTLGDLPHAVLGQLDGKPIVLAKLLLPLIRELDPALQSVLVTLSLGEVDAALQPLIKVELPGLITQLSGLVQGLLVALAPLLTGVGSLLAPILTGLGL